VRPFAHVLVALAFSACSAGAVPQALSTAPPAPRPAPAASATPVGTPAVRAPSDIARDCRIERTSAGGPLRFDWEKTVARGPSAAINALAATGDGVLVAGAESRERAQSQPFVAAFDADGRERYRVTLDEPRSTTTPARGVAVAVAGTASGGAYVVSTAARVDGSSVVALLAPRCARSHSLLDAGGAFGLRGALACRRAER